MKVLIVYDSQYGNTERLAQVIGDAFAGQLRVLRASEANPSELKSIEVLIVGSPTQGGRPTQAIANFLGRIPSKGLRGVRVAAFDTRLSARNRGLGMRLLIRIVGYAGNRIAARLQAAGGSLLAPPEGFIVERKEGPLKQGEIERAAAWAEQLQQTDRIEQPAVIRPTEHV